MNASLSDQSPVNQSPDFAGLIRWLLRQAQQADENSRARAALAELRRGLRDDPRDRLIVGKYVVPFLGAEPHTDWQRWQESCCNLVSSLFASHPVHKPGVSLGAAMGQMQADSGSIEARFLNLLTVRSDRLHVPMRQIISLLAANNTPLDWGMLLNDLRYWDDTNKRVQQRWARAFYQSAPDPALDPALDRGDIPNGDTDEN